MSHLFAFKDSEAARSLAKKLHEQGKPGALVLLSDEEWAEVKKVHILQLPDPEPRPWWKLW